MPKIIQNFSGEFHRKRYNNSMSGKATSGGYE